MNKWCHSLCIAAGGTARVEGASAHQLPSTIIRMCMSAFRYNSVKKGCSEMTPVVCACAHCSGACQYIAHNASETLCPTHAHSHKTAPSLHLLSIHIQCTRWCRARRLTLPPKPGRSAGITSPTTVHIQCSVLQASTPPAAMAPYMVPSRDIPHDCECF